MKEFQQAIIQGIPNILPQPQVWDADINHAPKRKEILNVEEKKISTTKCFTLFRT